MAGIFISYRREESGPWAARLDDAMAARFGRARVFFDIDAISPGRDFRDSIRNALAASDVLLAVIGKQWENLCDESGCQRLSCENDYVRFEIATALEKGLHVIPILVAGARMPASAALPPDLEPLTFRNAMMLSDRHFHQDVRLLVKVLNPVVGELLSLFPLFGVTLGKTTEIEIAKVGTRSPTIDSSTGQPYTYYVFNDVEFWYDVKSRVVNQLYFARSYMGSFPAPWERLGVRWENSYDEWTALLKNFGYLITVKEEPYIALFNGHDSFSAEVTARKEAPHPHEIELIFGYESGTEVKSPGTLYSVQIRAMEKDQFDEAVAKDLLAEVNKLSVEEQEAKLTAEQWYRKGLEEQHLYWGFEFYFGRRRRRKPDPDEALRCYNNAILLDTNYSDAYFRRAELRDKKGDTDGAIEDVNRTMQLGFPHMHNCYLKRGWYREQKDDLDGALEDYDEAIRLIRLNLPGLDHGLWSALKSRAMAREKRGNLAGSAQDYSEIIPMHPDWTDTVELYECRARVHERMGDRFGATQDHKDGERLRIHFVVEEITRNKGRNGPAI